MKQEESVVYVVDDDPSLRGAIDSLLRSAGWRVQTFVSARDFLDAKPRARHACLVLDVGLPGLSGLDLQSELIKKQDPDSRHFHHRPRRRPDVRTRDEGRRGGVSHQAV